MEAKKLEATIKIDADGHLQGDAEVLARLSNQTFTLRMEGTTITLQPRRLYEIENIDERMAAYAAFKQQVVRPGGAQLPEDWESIRDSIYD